MALILEVLDRRTGEVRQWRRLDGGPLTLGRAYDNDLVLDDPYVDARHAWIGLDEAGGLAITDLGSLNGLVGADAARHDRLPLGPGMEVRIGRTVLRFRDPDAALPPARRDGPTAGIRLPRWATRWWGQAAVVAAATAAVAWTTWRSHYDASSGSNAVGTAVGFLVIALAWASGWAVGGRIAGHRARLLGHLAVVSAVALAGVAWFEASEWGEFLFPDAGLVIDVSAVVALLLFAVLVAGHLVLASGLSHRRRWVAGLIASGVLLAVGGIFTAVEDDSFSDVPSYSGILKPFPVRWLPTRTVDDFTGAAEALRDEVELLAEED